MDSSGEEWTPLLISDYGDDSLLSELRAIYKSQKGLKTIIELNERPAVNNVGTVDSTNVHLTLYKGVTLARTFLPSGLPIPEGTLFSFGYTDPSTLNWVDIEELDTSLVTFGGANGNKMFAIFKSC